MLIEHGLIGPPLHCWLDGWERREQIDERNPGFATKTNSRAALRWMRWIKEMCSASQYLHIHVGKRCISPEEDVLLVFLLHLSGLNTQLLDLSLRGYVIPLPDSP